MRAYKLKALMVRDMKIFTRSKWRFAEFFYFPITTVIIWGLFALFTRDFSPETGLMVLGVNVFWSFAYLAQSTANLQINEDHWSGSFRQVMCSGFTEFEYLAARLVTSTLVSAATMAVMLAVGLGFGLSVFLDHWTLTLALSVITLLGSLALAVMVAALMLIFGREYGFLAWTILQVFVLLSAPLYPLEVLPEAFQIIAQGMPFTHVFMGVRELITSGSVSLDLLVSSIKVIAIYIAFSIPLYYLAFKRAKRNGMLARLY